MNKRVFAAILALAMALALLPGTALADVIDDASYTMDFTGVGTSYWHDRTTGKNYTTQNDSDSAGWAWYATAKTVAGVTYAAKTLVLNNFRFTTSAPIALKLPAGATIIVFGTNSFTVNNTVTASTISYGIQTAGALTVTGSGSLSATGGSVSGASSKSVGVYAIGNIAVESGSRLSGTGGTAGRGSYGIDCGSLRVTASGSRATGVSKTANEESIAIHVDGGSGTITGNVLAPSGGVIGDWTNVAGSSIQTVLTANGQPATAATLGIGEGPADVPQTGDGSTPWLWIGMMALASAGLVILRKRRRTQK